MKHTNLCPAHIVLIAERVELRQRTQRRGPRPDSVYDVTLG